MPKNRDSNHIDYVFSAKKFALVVTVTKSCHKLQCTVSELHTEFCLHIYLEYQISLNFCKLLFILRHKKFLFQLVYNSDS